MNGNAKELLTLVDATIASQISFAQRSKRKSESRPFVKKCKRVVADSFSKIGGTGLI